MNTSPATGGADISELDDLILCYCRQIIMQTMNHIRSEMRERWDSADHWQQITSHQSQCEVGRQEAI